MRTPRPHHRCVIALLLVGPAAPLLAWAPPVVLDGDAGEWIDIPPAIIDPAGDARGPVDLRFVHAAADARDVFWRIELGREVNLQRLPRTIEVLVDADGDDATGQRERELAGVDVTLVFSPRDPQRPDEPGQGLTARWAGQGPPAPEEGRLNPTYHVDFIAAPTHSSTWFEMRLRRGPAWSGGPTLFSGASYDMAVRVLDLTGDVVDLAGPVTVALPDRGDPAAGSSAATPDPIARAEGATLRVVSWNTEFGALFDDPRPFRNVLRALEPDVILLQEIPDKRPASELRALLEDQLPAPDGKRWNLVYADGGGNLRCAIAAVEPLTALPSTRLVAYPRRPDRSVRVAGAILHHRDRHVVLASVHLTCCGGLGEPRDERRQTEATLINAALARAGEAAPVDAIIVAGDFNLVGSAAPLHIIAERLGPGGAPLEAAPALQLDGRSNVTWSDARQPFAPGRLDYLLYGGAPLTLVRSFTLDSRDLDAAVRQRYELDANDTDLASDHLPIVADFAVGDDAAPAGAAGRAGGAR